MSNNSAEVRRVLEGLRQRFSTLTESTSSLVNLIASSTPPFDQGPLLTQYTVVATHQQAVTEHLARHHDLLMAVTAFPTPDFRPKPGSTAAEGMLLQMIRKKPDPAVDDWLTAAGELFSRNARMEGEEYAGYAAYADATGQPEGNPDAKMAASEWLELWAWAPEAAKAEVAAFMEHEEDEDEDEDDDDEEGGESDEEMKDDTIDLEKTKGPALKVPSKEDVPPAEPISLSRMLRYYSTGTMPPPEQAKPPTMQRPPQRPMGPMSR